MTFGALGGFLRTPKNPPGYGPDLLIAYFLSNICAKNYQIQSMYVRHIARQSSDIFGTQCTSLQQVNRESIC